MSALAEIFRYLLAPGFVAALVSFGLNTRDERHRTAREFQTKFLDETRKDVRDAVNAGVAYFSNSDDAKAPALYATVLLFEHEVRSGLASVRSSCRDDDKRHSQSIAALERDFLDFLTGGEFGPSAAAHDPDRIRMIVGQGTLLRHELANLRRHQLEPLHFERAKPILIITLLAVIFGVGVLYGMSFAATYSQTQ